MAMDTGGTEEGEPVAEINVTSMVDVLLSLLIIFMVSAPGAPNEKMPLNIPKETIVQQPDDPDAALVVTIAADGSARLGQTPLNASYDAMVEQFKASEKAQTDSKVVIQGDPKAAYRYIIQVMAAAHESGIAEVGVASDRL